MLPTCGSMPMGKVLPFPDLTTASHPTKAHVYPQRHPTTTTRIFAESTCLAQVQPSTYKSVHFTPSPMQTPFHRSGSCGSEKRRIWPRSHSHEGGDQNLHPDPDSTPPQGKVTSTQGPTRAGHTSWSVVCKGKVGESRQAKNWPLGQHWGWGAGCGPEVQPPRPLPLTKTFAGKRSGDWVQIFFLSLWRWQDLTQSPGGQQR